MRGFIINNKYLYLHLYLYTFVYVSVSAAISFLGIRMFVYLVVFHTFPFPGARAEIKCQSLKRNQQAHILRIFCSTFCQFSVAMLSLSNPPIPSPFLTHKLIHALCS